MANTKQNSKFLKVVIALIILTMLALIALSGTYAKYTTSKTGTGTAVVANWDIDFTDGNNAEITSFDVNLADTITSNDSGNTFIQPGSKGTFTIKVTNNSQVSASLKAIITNKSNTTFTQDQFTFTVTDDGTDVTDGTSTLAPGATRTLKVDWEWVYNKTADADTEDTTLGEGATTPKTIYTVELTATQVNPNA